MRNGLAPLDFIEFLPIQSTRIIDIVAPLAKKGQSITEIANETGLKRTSIWKALRMQRRKKIAQSTFSVKAWRKKHDHLKQKPPYGYCRFQGQVIKDPKEYPVMSWIQHEWKRGESINSIILKLSARGAKSRTGKSWSYNVIKSIIKRIGEPSPETSNQKTNSINLEEV